MKPGWRLAWLGVLFIGLFALLGLRLWFLQVTTGQAFAAQATQQQIKIVDIPAARGEILDRNGVLLAGTKAAFAVVVDASLLPAQPEQEAVVQRLSSLLDIAPIEIRAQIDIAGDRSRFQLVSDITEAQALFVREHGEDFRGVFIEEVPVRVYPAGIHAAHVIGYIGKPSDADLQRSEINPGDVVGKFGVEKQYDEWLRGTSGKVKFRVDATRDVVSAAGTNPATPGGTAILTIDLDIQKVLESALQAGIDLARSEGEDARRAAGVVLDATTGEVLAMASSPSYRPEIFVPSLTQSEWAALEGLGAFNNFAIQGIYPPASTFKVIGYVMGMEEGVFPLDMVSSEQTYFCDGRLEFINNLGERSTFDDWRRDGHGAVDSHTALQASCDLYFWEIALSVWRNRNEADGDEGLIQDWARRFGFGRPTGIDLPFEQAGLVGDREWFDQAQRDTPGRVRAEGAWSGGDVMNVVIGQGLVTSTPLQLATAYAGILNGGTVWVPHVVDRIVDSAGNTILDVEPEAAAEIPLDSRTVTLVREDLRLVVNGPSGTARRAFADFPEFARNQIGGKTGTAEIDKEEDINTAWFVGAAPIGNPRFVVAIVIERGGGGGKIAAPTARQVFEFLLLNRVPENIVAGEDTD